MGAVKQPFIIKYKTWNDPGSPIFSQRVMRYNAEHAEVAFLESCDDECDWEIVSITRERKRG